MSDVIAQRPKFQGFFLFFFYGLFGEARLDARAFLFLLAAVGAAEDCGDPIRSSGQLDQIILGGVGYHCATAPTCARD